MNWISTQEDQSQESKPILTCSNQPRTFMGKRWTLRWILWIAWLGSRIKLMQLAPIKKPFIRSHRSIYKGSLTGWTRICTLSNRRITSTLRGTLFTPSKAQGNRMGLSEEIPLWGAKCPKTTGAIKCNSTSRVDQTCMADQISWLLSKV